MSLQFYLRPVTNDDESFLYSIYKASRAAEFAPLQLPEAQFDTLMRMQYQLREQSYRGQYPDARHSIVCLESLPMGHIRIHRTPVEYRIVDIAFEAGAQGRGIGTAVVNSLIAEASEARIPLRCSVATNNPGSLRFHQRLGFTVIAEDPMYLELEHSPK
jgi:ribosomal protein S18 acetylase RimI-like enzyme